MWRRSIGSCHDWLFRMRLATLATLRQFFGGPRSSIAWNVASRFVAGVTVGDAIGVIRGLNETCINATLDQLGENTSTVEEADRATGGIIEILNKIEKAGVRANVSIKLTQIGMGLD